METYKKGDGIITKNGHTMFLQDVVEDIKNLQRVNTKLETKLKAAEDHAATMETCAKNAEEKLELRVPIKFCRYLQGLSCHHSKQFGRLCEKGKTCPMIKNKD